MVHTKKDLLIVYEMFSEIFLVMSSWFFGRRLLYHSRPNGVQPGGACTF